MSQNKNLGFIIVLVAGGLALLSFFAMPFLAFGPISFTGEQIASLAAQYSQYSSSSSSSQGFLLLWLAPAVSAVILLVAALQLRGSVRLSTKKTAAGWLIALAVVGLVVYVGIIIYANQLSNFSSSSVSITSLLGSGFWIYILSMVAVIVGGIIQLNMKSPAQVVQSSAPPWQSPPPAPPSSQYPPSQSYQQPWSQPPQYPPTQQSPGPGPSQWPPSPPNQ